mgnify:FL=1
MLLEKIQTLKPVNVLDMGCGAGKFTKVISQYCGHITAIDVSSTLIEQCKKENTLPNVEYLCLDGRNTGFPGKSFDCVIERASLHHMMKWEDAITEMIRLSSKYVLIAEPLDDDRSVEKRNLNEAQELYLKVQHDAGFEHYNHLKKELLLDLLDSKGINYEYKIEKWDDIIEFDEYFGMYEYFADKTSKKEHWMKRLNEFRTKLGGEKLCANDVIHIFFEI